MQRQSECEETSATPYERIRIARVWIGVVGQVNEGTVPALWASDEIGSKLRIDVVKAAELMQADVDKFAKHATIEMGKLINEARGEVDFSANILAYYAKNSERFLAPVKLNPTHGEAHMESSPIGVIFAVEPWNFPYYQLARD
jgi:delta 1-pyrroline-5-carboxylate dehydrogenase